MNQQTYVEAEYLAEIGMNQYIDSVRTNENGIINNTIQIEPAWDG